MRNLIELRDEIDDIDRQMKSLYEKRLSIAGEVAEYKLSQGKAVFDKQREKDKLRTLLADTSDPFLRQGLTEFFELLMATSRKRQYGLLRKNGRMEDLGFTAVENVDFSTATVVYQGVEGAYSQAAMLSFFGEVKSSFHLESWRETVEALAAGRADYCVLPIENSTAGSVEGIYDLLIEHDLSIIGEQIISIEHALLGLPGARLSDIRRICSHPQALMQCERFLLTHPQIEAEAAENTAAAAQRVRKDGDKTQAAIAGKINAKLYGLCVLEEAIQDQKDNQTRFIILSPKKIFRKDADKISISFELPHTKGSLYHMLAHLTYNGLNLSLIESRPIRGRSWEYRFFIDIEGNLMDDGVRNVLVGLQDESIGFRILGNY